MWILLLISVLLGAAVHPTLSLLIYPSVYYPKTDLMITEHPAVQQNHKTLKLFAEKSVSPGGARFHSREENN